jgi:hypothetical protein
MGRLLFAFCLVALGLTPTLLYSAQDGEPEPDHPRSEQPAGEMSGRGLYPSPRSSGVPPRPEGRGLPRFDDHQVLESSTLQPTERPPTEESITSPLFTSDSQAPGDCPICLETLSADPSDSVLPLCIQDSHRHTTHHSTYYHRACLFRWAAQNSNSCPICRGRMQIPSLPLSLATAETGETGEARRALEERIQEHQTLEITLTSQISEEERVYHIRQASTFCLAVGLAGCIEAISLISPLPETAQIQERLLELVIGGSTVYVFGEYVRYFCIRNQRIHRLLELVHNRRSLEEEWLTLESGASSP